MATVLAIVNQKGGVGKTTTAVNFAVGLANHNHRVLILDLDPQGNATSALGIDRNSIGASAYEGLLGLADFQDTIRSTEITNLDIIPATAALAGANVELVQVERREFVLADRLPDVTGNYDYVLIDCPPSLGLLTINALAASHEVLIPVQAEYLALEGLGQLLETVHLIQENLNPSLGIRGAVVTMYDYESDLAHSVHRQLYEFFPYRIFRTVVPRHVKLAEAPSFGNSIFAYAPASPGAKAYHKFTREFLEIIG